MWPCGVTDFGEAIGRTERRPRGGTTSTGSEARYFMASCGAKPAAALPHFRASPPEDYDSIAPQDDRRAARAPTRKASNALTPIAQFLRAAHRSRIVIPDGFSGVASAHSTAIDVSMKRFADHAGGHRQVSPAHEADMRTISGAKFRRQPIHSAQKFDGDANSSAARQHHA